MESEPSHILYYLETILEDHSNPFNTIGSNGVQLTVIRSDYGKEEERLQTAGIMEIWGDFVYQFEESGRYFSSLILKVEHATTTDVMAIIQYLADKKISCSVELEECRNDTDEHYFCTVPKLHLRKGSISFSEERFYIPAQSKIYHLWIGYLCTLSSDCVVKMEDLNVYRTYFPSFCAADKVRNDRTLNLRSITPSYGLPTSQLLFNLFKRVLSF